MSKYNINSKIKVGDLVTVLDYRSLPDLTLCGKDEDMLKYIGKKLKVTKISDRNNFYYLIRASFLRQTG
jgi:hypothetical protein